MHNASEYYSAIQLRADSWSRLRETVRSLERETSAAKIKQLCKDAEGLFNSLGGVERYWAFPGMSAFDYMRRQFEHGHYGELAFSVHRVTRALTTGAYRRRHIPLDRENADKEEQDDEAMLGPEARSLSKPYFEVLIVDDVNEQQERWLRNNVARMRRSEDPFIYEAVVVPSVEDALIGVLFNHNIQAIVVRPG